MLACVSRADLTGLFLSPSSRLEVSEQSSEKPRSGWWILVTGALVPAERSRWATITKKDQVRCNKKLVFGYFYHLVNILLLASQKVPHSGYMAVQKHQTGRTWKRHISEGRPVIKTGTSPCKWTREREVKVLKHIIFLAGTDEHNLWLHLNCATGSRIPSGPDISVTDLNTAMCCGTWKGHFVSCDKKRKELNTDSLWQFDDKLIEIFQSLKNLKPSAYCYIYIF